MGRNCTGRIKQIKLTKDYKYFNKKDYDKTPIEKRYGGFFSIHKFFRVLNFHWIIFTMIDLIGFAG